MNEQVLNPQYRSRSKVLKLEDTHASAASLCYASAGAEPPFPEVEVEPELVVDIDIDVDATDCVDCVEPLSPGRAKRIPVNSLHTSVSR